MEAMKPKVPVEAVQLYNLFIHGNMSRRDFMDGIQRLAVGSISAAAMVEALMPNYAAGQQVSKTDDRIKTSYETVPSPNGNGSIKGYFVRPVSADTREAKPAKLPGILVVHENRGLNPHIEDIARRLALANFMAFAPDGLTSLGGFPGDDYNGGQLFNKIDKKKMFEDMVASAQWLKGRADCTGKIGVTGFCYGGQRLEPACRAAGSGFVGGGAVLRRASAGSGYPEHQGGDPGTARRARQGDGRHVAGIRQGADGDQCSARRVYLSECGAWLQLRCDAGTVQQRGGGPGVVAHDWVVQQIRAWVIATELRAGCWWWQ